MNYIRLMIVVLISSCLLAAGNSFAQLPSVKASIDKSHILIGQPLNLKVEATLPGDTYRLNWFSVPDSLARFVVINRNKPDSGSSNGNKHFTQVIALTNFDSGRQVIPPLLLTASTLDGDSTFTIYTDSIPVNVSYSPLDSIQPFHDIKAIIEVEKGWAWWAWALLVLGIILLAGGIFFLTRFLKKKKVPLLFTADLLPFEEAMQSLSVLAGEKLLQDNKVKEYHTRLTEIFKRYLSRVSNSYKWHLTSDEVLMELSDFNFPKEQIAGFAGCLRMGNAVKFAQYIPPFYENEECFSSTKEMIIAINSAMNKKSEK